MSTFTKRIDANIRDVGYTNTSPAESSAISLGNPGAVTRSLAYRFTSVTIPQGATISSAKLTFTASTARSSQTINIKIHGVDEDNTAEFVISPEDTARTRTKTTANVDWDATITTSVNSTFDSADITSIVQEIVDRVGWSSGNAMAFWVTDDGSSGGNYVDATDYNATSSEATLLTVNYVAGSPSPSLSPSSSISASPSATPSESPSSSPSLSPSLSPSASVSSSPSSSISPSPSPIDYFAGLKISKPGFNVLRETDPNNLTFSSEYETLKYYAKSSVQVQIDANNGDIAGTGTYTHNLGYYPFVEVYVDVYIGTPSGTYEYCPFAGAGATVLYSANYKVTSTAINLYTYIDGVSTSLWVFDFIVFVYKNNLGF